MRKGFMTVQQKEGSCQKGWYEIGIQRPAQKFGPEVGHALGFHTADPGLILGLLLILYSGITFGRPWETTWDAQFQIEHMQGK